jgi:prepilin-type N-terminal cleavage/methylation domain-containing protein
MKQTISIRRARRGFTLVEIMVVSGLLVVLAVLVSNAWAGLGRPLVNVATQCRLANEANAAAACLARDLCGSLADTQGRLGAKTAYQFVGRMQPGNAQLWLCFDSGTNPNGKADWGPPDTVIVYQLAGNTLVRWNQTAGTNFTVAQNVSSFNVQDLGGGQVQIMLTFQYRNLTQTYTWIALDP